MERKSFVLYTSMQELTDDLTDEQKGQLLQVIFDYVTGKELNISDKLVKVTFTSIKQQLDRDGLKWEEKKQKRSEAGKKGMQSRWGNKNNNVIDVNNKNNNVIEVTDKTNYQEIADMYNNICISYPRLKTLSDARRKAIKARLKQYSTEDFKKVFEMAEQSDFLKGANSRNWAANFDWLVKDSNFAKVLDGNYTNKQGVTTHGNITISAPNSNQRKDYEEIDKLLYG